MGFYVCVSDSLLTWRHPASTKSLFFMLSVITLASCFFNASTLFFMAGQSSTALRDSSVLFCDTQLISGYLCPGRSVIHSCKCKVTLLPGRSVIHSCQCKVTLLPARSVINSSQCLVTCLPFRSFIHFSTTELLPLPSYPGLYFTLPVSLLCVNNLPCYHRPVPGGQAVSAGLPLHEVPPIQDEVRLHLQNVASAAHGR